MTTTIKYFYKNYVVVIFYVLLFVLCYMCEFMCDINVKIML